MTLCDDTYNNHRHESGNDKTSIDGKIGEPDEPSVAGAGLQLTSAFGAADRSSRVFTTNTNTQKESVSSESSQQTVNTTTITVRTSGKRSKDELSR